MWATLGCPSDVGNVINKLIRHTLSTIAAYPQLNIPQTINLVIFYYILYPVAILVKYRYLFILYKY